MKYYIAIILSLMLVFAGVSAYASDISDANYYGIIVITNNSTLASGVSANISGMNSTRLISGGYLNSTANNTAIQHAGADVAFMPGYGSNPWVVWAGDMGADSIKTDTFYAKNVTGGLIYYFPGNLGMTIADKPSLEWGATGNVSVTAYFNPTSTENITSKTSAYKITGGGDGTIYGSVYNGTSSNTTFRPNAAGDLTELTPSAGTNYACAGDANDATTVRTTSLVYKTDLYNTANHSTEKGLIDSVVVYFRYKTENLGTISILPVWKIGGVSYDGTLKTTASTSLVTTSQTYTVSPATGKAWTWTELDGAQIGISIKDTGGYTGYCADVWYSVYQAAAACEVSGVSVGEHTFKLGISGGTASLQVNDGVADTAAFTGTVTNNSNAIRIGDDNITPYIISASMGVGAALVSAWEWEYGATFHDSIGSNDATPVFRTTSSDADVSAVIQTFLPVIQPTAPPFAIGEGPWFLSTNITASSNFTSGNATLDYPFKEIIDSVATSGGVPYQIPSTFISTFAIIFLSMATSFLMKQYGATSLFVKSVVNFACYGVLIALNIYDWWMLLMFFMFEQAIWFAAKERRE